MWKIGNIEIANQVVLAPMAGISNEAFRTIAKQFGAGLIYAEMVSDKALMYQNVKTLGMTNVNKDEHPLTMQLFGKDVDSMVKAAIQIDKDCDCDIIDINMGCPVNKVIKAGSGSALMKDIPYATNLIKEIIANVNKPVTVKMRSGWDNDHINAVELAKSLESIGVAAIAVHGRTRKQMYEGTADWSIIKAVKQAVNIPVIGNGDIKTPLDAKRMLEETGCDAVMIGRAALGNPWIIKETVNYLENGIITDEANIEEKFKLARLHANKLVTLKGEKVGMKEMRGHGAWYVKGLHGSHQIKDQLAKVNTLEEFNNILSKYEEEYGTMNIIKD
ncbi:MAG: tRNA dihydrouridine synthase DusB [Erysipelotrichaceae bacterium]